MKRLMKGAAISLALMSVGAAVGAQAAPPLKANQTAGYADGKLLTFTYLQNFLCVEQPGNDLNFNGIPSGKDPSETQSPICQAGARPTINPPGVTGVQKTAPIYVLVPMFSVDNDQNPNDAISCTGVVAGTVCGPALGSALIKWFGALPEAFKAKSLVYTQCPDPASQPGTCTMHAAQIDLAPVLAELGFTANPPTANVFVPSPNHSHVISYTDQATIWWQVRPVLVLTQADWPSQDGATGLTSVAAVEKAIRAKQAVEAPSNFFLYFHSQMMGMNMPMGH
jgi:hypothetical protein